MLIRPDELAGIRAGEIDLAFRRWDRPRLKVGTRMRTGIGLVEVTSVDAVPQRALTAEQARRAGAPSLAALRQALAARPDRPIYRVGLRYAGADPRAALRDDVPDDAEIARLRDWLDRLDRSATTGAWTRDTLRIIDENPAVRAPELAAALGRDTPSFKRDVRKLKERGLTESLDIGYRLSRRGAAVLDHGGPARDRPEPEPGTPLPRIGAPASRALTAHGITRLEQLAGVTESELAALHGVGPQALRILSETMTAVGLQYAAPPGR
jgi:DNA-binding MarR family transcriptional regulator